MRSALVPIFLVVLVDLLAMMMIVPLLPFYAETYGASAFQIGLLASSFAVCQLFASPVLGWLSDRWGRKPVLIFSQLGTFLGFLLMAWATRLWMLFAARIIDGITAGNLPLAQACIADVTKPEERARAFGIIGVAFGAGLVLGPALSGLLAGYGWAYPIYVAAGLSALSAVVTALLLPRLKPATDAAPIGGTGLRDVFGFFTRPDLGGLLARYSVYVFAFAYFSQGLGLFAQGRFHRADGQPFGPSEVGYLLAYCGVLGVLVQGVLLGKLVKRFGEPSLARAGFVADILGYGSLAFAGNLPALLLSCTLFSIGNALLRPVLTSLITQQVSRREQGIVLGLTASLQSAGLVLAPPLGGWLIDGQNLTLWALGLAIFCALGTLQWRARPKVSLSPRP